MTPTTPPRRPLFDPALLLAANALDDLERTTIALNNRYRQATRTTPDDDGIMRGFALPPELPEVRQLHDLGVMLQCGKTRRRDLALTDGTRRPCCLLHQAEKNLQTRMEAHPLWALWGERQRGVGAKQLARLLGTIGDPYIRPDWTRRDGVIIPEGPRRYRSLLRYCGLDVWSIDSATGILVASGTDASSGGGQSPVGGDPGHGVGASQIPVIGVAPHRRKGIKVSWCDEARKRVWLVASQCRKAGFDATTCQSKTAAVKAAKDAGTDPDDLPTDTTHGPDCGCGRYRLIYDQARTRYVDAVHQVECVRCGPSGKPAEAGSVLSLKHQDARAVRAVMQAVLKDLWLVGREYHTGIPTTAPVDTVTEEGVG